MKTKYIRVIVIYEENISTNRVKSESSSADVSNISLFYQF